MSAVLSESFPQNLSTTIRPPKSESFGSDGWGISDLKQRGVPIPGLILGGTEAQLSSPALDLLPTSGQMLAGYRMSKSYVPAAISMAKSELLAEWHGQVIAMEDDYFVAELRGVHGQDIVGCLDEAEIPMTEVRPDDRELLTVGAFFRLSISYETHVRGTVRRYTEVIFRRMPAYREAALRDAAQRATEIVRDLQLE